ncbi:hypothetical protein [Streptomyces sp. AC627_RSS907]|uniref:hypothetical protein n=1 Tax=Streptomyces sp. AC627_RSS907 TaxID=2823684 RepID=UPI001C248CC5|nr:hypothetical protein [Streptomyces sp. AC627_RSS907]
MGVFARLLRRSKATEEAPAAETRAATPDTPETGRAAEDATQAAETADAGPRNTARPAEPDEADVADDPEGVGIPKQQSAGEAVDNDSDEGART